jgi:hypothetical protein
MEKQHILTAFPFDFLAFLIFKEKSIPLFLITKFLNFKYLITDLSI